MKPYQIVEQKERENGAADYDKWYVSSKGKLFDLRERDVFANIAKKVRPRSVIDIGAGTGRITEAVAPFAESVTAMDFSPASLRVLEAKGLENVRAMQGDVTRSIPCPPGSFDLAVSCQVLQHFHLDDLLNALREIGRVTNGIFAWGVENFHYFRNKGVSEIQESNGLYIKRFSIGYVRYLAGMSGFRVKDILFYGTAPHRIFFRENPSGLKIEKILGGFPYANKMLSRYMCVIFQKEN